MLNVQKCMNMTNVYTYARHYAGIKNNPLIRFSSDRLLLSQQDYAHLTNYLSNQWPCFMLVAYPLDIRGCCSQIEMSGTSGHNLSCNYVPPMLQRNPHFVFNPLDV